MKSHRGQLSAVNNKLAANRDEIHRRLVVNCCRVHSASIDLSELERIVQNLDYTSLEQVTSLLVAAELLVETVYSTAVEHFAANQIAALIRKYPFPVIGIENAARDRAVVKFQMYEAKCRSTNEIFSTPAHPSRPSEHLLHRMRSYIAFVLGETPPLAEIFDKCGFGPGASIGVSGNATNVKRKLSASRWSVSASALDYARAAMKGHSQILELLVEPSDALSADVSSLFDTSFERRANVINNNNITFVPKTTLIMRSIAVEPLLNGYLQKGIDEYMRTRLKNRARIDLSNQSLNSLMAREGSLSKDNPFCTIDLSSASDSIASSVVRELLPYDWFYLLDRVRSKSYKLENEIFSFSKFCSMGNGFCFPLQTLLFSAACFAVESGDSGIDFRVYGDDIIVRQSSFDSLVALLGQLGFDVNQSKTFGSGPFRESCGMDYYLGVDVRPVQLDYALDSVQNVMKFHNSWYRSAICLCFGEPFLPSLREMIPQRFRFVAPDYSDVTDQAFRVQKSSAEYLTSPHTSFSRKLWCTRWKEFVTRPLVDRFVCDMSEREYGVAVLYAALSGADSKAPFTFRRKTKTNIRIVAYG